MGMINIITDILKFPWPLFPKFKNVYPCGFRFEIPAAAQDLEFVISLPPGKTYELQSFVFSATGYKDGDAYSLTRDGNYILSHIYTKELGQVLDIRPVVKINSTDNLKFIYHNNTGTSKVVWIDLILTSSGVITISDV